MIDKNVINSNNVHEWLKEDQSKRIERKAKEIIKKYGRLFFCKSKICACMGCANSMMTEDEVLIAKEIPEIKNMLNDLANKSNIMTLDRVDEYAKLFDKL